MLAQCPAYWQHVVPLNFEVHNCAGLAWRTYDYRGNRTAERSAVAAGRTVAAVDPCRPGEAKHWFWD
jgi:hypothetical protein